MGSFNPVLFPPLKAQSRFVSILSSFCKLVRETVHIRASFRRAAMLDKIGCRDPIHFKRGWFDPQTNTLHLDSLKVEVEDNIHFHSDTHLIFTSRTGEAPNPSCFYGVWTNPELDVHGNPICNLTEVQKAAVRRKLKDMGISVQGPLYVDEEGNECNPETGCCT